MSSLLSVFGITHRFGSRTVLDEISFEVERGEILALLGPNGSGKSTLMKAIAGLLPLARGNGIVRLRGTDFLTEPPRWRATQIAYVAPDLRAEFPLTALQAVQVGRTCHGSGFFGRLAEEDVQAVEWAMRSCLCWSLRDRDLHTLSGGERQLVNLARALAQGAKILFLDEALSRMDLNHQASVGKLLRSLAKEGWTVILVSHDLNVASEWADSCLLLREGKLLARGLLRETLNDDSIRKLYPGSELFVGTNPATGAPKVFFK